MKKVILSGIIAGLLMLIVEFGITGLFGLFPQVNADYHNPSIISAVSGSSILTLVVFLYPFILGIIFSWLWGKSKSLFEGAWIRRGLYFGIVIGFLTLFIFTIPAAIVSSFSLLTIVSLIVSALFKSMVAGMTFSRMNK
ncbi:MAG: hypothetical protein PHV47_01640 [Candidatus Pacebacteria bacterium]|nr:hypothetical protein [Candidatus Paceibacterota bacterium]